MAHFRHAAVFTLCLLNLTLFGLAGCEKRSVSSDATPLDARAVDAQAADGHADDGAYRDGSPDVAQEACPAIGSDVGAGIVALLNQPTTDATLLTRGVDVGGAGLDATLAQRLIAGRPYANYGQINSPGGLDIDTCVGLTRLACQTHRFCGPRIRVVTWNLKTFPLATGTIAAVSEAIGLLNADVIGIQEVKTAASFDSLVAALPDYEGVLAKKGYFTGVGLLYRKSSVVALEHSSLFTTDPYAFPRPALRFRAKLGPREVTFIVLHLKAMLDADSQQRRVAACTAIDTWLRARSSEEVFVIGDWNDKLLDALPDNVFSKLLASPQDYRFISLPLEEAGTYSYLPYSSMIDHIMVTDDVLTGRDTATCFVPALNDSISNYSKVISDHLPVIATFPR